jgi:hypothetical protein
MKRIRHMAAVSRVPATAQISNYQIKLESTTAIIDRLLLVPRQQPWKSTGPSGTTTDTNTGTGTSTGTGLGGLGL